MDNLDFSEEEIQEQLAILGYRNIPKHRLCEFKKDLDELIRHGDWKTLASPTQINSSKSPTAPSQPSPPAYTKEKVSQCYIEDAGGGFFLHPRQEDHDRQVLTCQNGGHGRQQGRCDSYAQHSVALKLRLPPGVPSRLRVEPDPDDTLLPPLTDSLTSTPDTQGRCFIKRKVLRKHKGQPLVCDESVYSEDSDHTLHTPQAGVQVANMYKMYNNQWEDENDDDKNSLNSSFWSDGEHQEDKKEEEEEVKIERVIGEEDSKPVGDAEDSLQEASEEEKPDLNNDNMIGETSEGGSDDDDGSDDDTDDDDDDDDGDDGDDDDDDDDDDGIDDDDDGDDDNDEESCSSRCDSPAPSLLTSGYGTYRPEEQEGGEFRDDHTLTEFDQDSRGDLSEMRDDEEDDHSLSSFGGFDIEPTEPDCGETSPLRMLADVEPEALHVAGCGDDGVHEEVDITHMRPEEDADEADEAKSEDLLVASENGVTSATSEDDQPVPVVEDKFILNEKHLEGVSDYVEESERYERLEEGVQDLKEEDNVEKEDKAESEDPDESASNKDIKFIDSKVDFSQMTYDKMCEEWEGNLRQKKDATSLLEERLAELHLSTSAQHDFETDNEDVTSQSDTRSSATDGISLSAFESYIRGMTRAQSDGDIRPKPKSFIRPALGQQTKKKTDPVAKYFQYKQLWEIFKVPGESERRSLRQVVKERLAYQPPPPKPRKVYVPNTYIVPTEKRRSALRWEIRNDLANGLLPYKYNYRF